jgi:hypothetical protein
MLKMSPNSRGIRRRTARPICSHVRRAGAPHVFGSLVMGATRKKGDYVARLVLLGPSLTPHCRRQVCCGGEGAGSSPSALE